MNVIDRVEYGRIDRDGIEGLRISFFMDCDADNEHADIYEFFDSDDVVYLVRMIKTKVSPLGLMAEIRKRLRVTLH